MPLWQVALEIPVFYKQFSIHAMYLFGIFLHGCKRVKPGLFVQWGQMLCLFFIASGRSGQEVGTGTITTNI
jgi:hypothetical protein